MKPRLLIATDNFAPRWDGIARFLLEVLPALKEVFDVTVVAPVFGQSRSTDDIIRVPLRSFSVGDFRPARHAPRLIRRLVRESDIVFTQTIGPIGGLALYFAQRAKKPSVAFIHSVEWELVSKAVSAASLKLVAKMAVLHIARYLYRRADLLVLPSQNTLEFVNWHIGHVPKRVVHLGCDTKNFKAGAKREAKDALGLPKDAIVVGYHGRLSREKDLVTLMRAFNRLQKSVKGVKLLIVGDGLESVRRALDREHVVLVGARDDVVPYLQAMDIYVMPSLTETTCLSVLEAMACELPVIATRVGFVQDYIISGKNGFLVRKRDPIELYRRMKYLAEHELVRSQVGKEARETVRKEFSWDETATQVRDILVEVLGDRARHEDGAQTRSTTSARRAE
ncbi:MAG: glycosyltransferase [Nanoarchaeota archaeon]